MSENLKNQQKCEYKIDAHNHAYWMQDSELALLVEHRIEGCFFGGYSPDDWALQFGFQERVQAALKFHMEIWMCLGFHPWYLFELFSNNQQGFLKFDLLEVQASRNVFAIGETGLDYSAGLRRKGMLTPSFEWKKFQEFQKEIFFKHIQFAKKTGRPLVLHLVQAWEDANTLLNLSGIERNQLFYHRFSGDLTQLKEVFHKGAIVSFYSLPEGGSIIANDLEKKSLFEENFRSLLIQYSRQWVLESDFDQKNNHFRGFEKIGRIFANLLGVDVNNIFRHSAGNLRCFFKNHFNKTEVR